MNPVHGHPTPALPPRSAGLSARRGREKKECWHRVVRLHPRGRPLEFRGRLLLLLPLLVVLLAVIGWPLVDTFWLSFTNTPLGGITGAFVGLANYAHAFRSPGFWKAVGVTALFTIFTVGVEMILGLGVGLLLDMNL